MSKYTIKQGLTEVKYRSTAVHAVWNVLPEIGSTTTITVVTLLGIFVKKKIVQQGIMICYKSAIFNLLLHQDIF